MHMKIVLHIEQLLTHDRIDLGRDGGSVARAVQGELQRLMAEPHAASRVSVAAGGPSGQRGASATVTTRVARAVHGALQAKLAAPARKAKS
jgi:hypothetical protein